jgi:enoyl-CoA hydratase
MAEEAERIGLINHVVPAEDLDRVVDAFAQELLGGATRAIQWTKLAVNLGLKQLAHSVMDASVAFEALSNVTADHREAVLALREKRPPRFTGK